jgi:hypothetical protein
MLDCMGNTDSKFTVGADFLHGNTLQHRHCAGTQKKKFPVYWHLILCVCICPFLKLENWLQVAYERKILSTAMGRTVLI